MGRGCEPGTMARSKTWKDKTTANDNYALAA